MAIILLWLSKSGDDKIVSMPFGLYTIRHRRSCVSSTPSFMAGSWWQVSSLFFLTPAPADLMSYSAVPSILHLNLLVPRVPDISGDT